MGWLTWSVTQNEISAAKQLDRQEREKAEQEAERAKQRARIAKEQAQQRAERDRYRKEHLDELADQLERRAADATNPAEAVRSFIEGDVHALDEDAKFEKDRIAELQYNRDRGRTRLLAQEFEFQQAWVARRDRLARAETIANFGARRTTVKRSKGSVIGSTAVLVLMETFLLRRPMELLTRHLTPDSGSVAQIALLLTLGLVALSTMSLLFAAKQWGEYKIAQDRADPAAVNSSGAAVGEAVASVLAWVSTIVAIMLQIVLFYLRFQTGTTSGPVRNALVTASALVVLASATVAFIEYQYSRGSGSVATDSSSSRTRGETVIEDYLELHRQVFTEIPRSINEAKRLRLQAIDRALRDYQRVAETKGAQLQQAIASQLTSVTAEIEAIPDVTFVEPPIPSIVVVSPSSNGVSHLDPPMGRGSDGRHVTVDPPSSRYS